MTAGSVPSVLVVGAGAGGLSTVEALRRKGFRGRITVLGDERHLPYDRPPLSKQVLAGQWEPERTLLRSDDALAALEADLLLDDTALSLDVAGRTVHTGSGLALSAEVIVLATGARPRTLPGQDGIAGVHVVRTLEDSLALRDDLRTCSQLVVVGDGVLGAETAATARGLGLNVTMTGPQSAPMAGQLGPVVAEVLGQLHVKHGVELRLGTGVAGLTADGAGRVDGVRLADGELLPADAVVVAIGASPATGWLAGSGLHLDDGIVCDTHCRAADGIYAVGDVARWQHALFAESLRLENRTNATEQAVAVASDILGEDKPYTPVPYFWTDQFDVKIQVHGRLPPGAAVDIVDGSVDDGRFVARYAVAGRTAGIVGWKMPKQTRLRRQDVVDALTA